MPENRGLVEPKANEQDQAQYDMFIANGMSIIYDSATSKKIINQIVKSPDPIEAVSDATLSVVEKLESSAEASKIKIQDSVLIHGSNALMGEIIGLAEAAGMNPLSDEQKYQAFSLAASKYIQRALKSGKITPEQLKAMSQEASQTPEGQKIAQQLGEQTQAPQQPVQADAPQPVQPNIPQPVNTPPTGGLLQRRPA